MDQDMTHRISVPSKESQGPRYSLVWKLVFFPKGNEQAPPTIESSSSQDGMSSDIGSSLSGDGVSDGCEGEAHNESGSSRGSISSSSSSSQESSAGVGESGSGGWGDGSGMEGMLSICRPEWGPPIRFGSASPARAGVKAVSKQALQALSS